MRNNTDSISLTLIASFASLTLIVGCASSTPTIDTGPDAEPTFDGLYEVKGGRMDQAWARRDVDLSQYSKIMLLGAGVEFRPGGSTRRQSMSTVGGTHYEVTPAQKARFREVMGQVFLEELSKSENYTIVSEPGPDVLLIQGALLDVVSFVPPDSVGNTQIYLSRVGEATLVLEMRDSITEAIMVRAVDRRAAENQAMGFTRSNRVSNSAEFRRLARVWAGILRNALDLYMAAEESAGE